MTLYERGAYYERKTVDLLRIEGYYCWQARGSRGPADVIAVKPGQLVLIQVKSGTAQITGAGWNALYKLASLLDAVPVVADWGPRRPVVLREITGPHTARSQFWPCRPWVTDEVHAAVVAQDGQDAPHEPGQADSRAWLAGLGLDDLGAP